MTLLSWSPIGRRGADTPTPTPPRKGEGLSIVALIAALALAGCSQESSREPFAESRTPPGLAERVAPPEGWAWGFLQVGEAPVQRYGVAAPPGAPRGEILILPDPGDSAEMWFETARDLGLRGHTVWVLEAPGQGGSGRYGLSGPPRGAAGEEAVRGVRAMLDGVIRPESRPVAVLADRRAAAVALAALAGRPAAGLILSAPAPEGEGGLAGRLGIGGEGWSRRTPDDVADKLTHDAARGGVRNAWKLANPDLRRPAAPLTLAQAPSPSAGAGVLVLTGDEAQQAQALCAGQCRLVRLPGAWPALHLEADAARARWLDEIDRFVRERRDHAALQSFSSPSPPDSVAARQATGEETPQDAASERRGGQ
ncbi:MAG: alpha/beta hydrolase [Caulobacteraceae bacterium]|nr:alpha/beta hydrolase [Caulobacteraceae bacterium]